MILPRYATAVASVDRDRVVSYLVRRDLRLTTRPMLYALAERQLGQADLVLALLRINTRGSRALIARIMGRPILVLPSYYLRWPVNGVPRVHVPRIARVLANPRKPNTTAHARFDQAFRPGRTVEEARAHGATRRDVRMARRCGWIEERAS
jgi:hypothetical protein